MPAAASSRDKVRDFRARMRAKGMKLVQIWVPDTSSANFRTEARRQSRLVAQTQHAAEDQAFIDAISDLN